MKHVLVTLGTRSGEYEDVSFHVFSTERKLSRKEAIAIAFTNEVRCDMDWDDEDHDSGYDCNGEIHITLNSVSRLTKAEAKVLHKYL